MKHVVIVAHPNPESFNLEVARTYCKAARERGHEPLVRDLYRMNFDPRLRAGEIPGVEGFTPAPDIVIEREMVRDAEVFAFVYPLWFYAPPAMIKGYIERVFSMGFGFGGIQGGGNTPKLRGRKMITFSSSGSPLEWVKQEGAWVAIRRLFDQHVSEVCGLTVVDHVHFGGVTIGMRTDVVTQYLATVRQTVSQHF